MNSILRTKADFVVQTKTNNPKIGIFQKKISRSDLAKYSMTVIPVLFFFGVILAASTFFYMKYDNLEKSRDEVLGMLSEKETQTQDATEILKSFGEIFSIDNEEPTVATIVDIEKLKEKNPEFYSNAKNGDRLIIISERRAAFIFRPEEHKIINIAFVNFDSN